MSVKLSIIPNLKKLSSKKENELKAVVKLLGPETEPTLKKKRLKLNVAVVLDSSGSMTGLPLENAKVACLKVLEHMQDDDLFSFVSYASKMQPFSFGRNEVSDFTNESSTVHLDSVPVSHAREVLKTILSGIHANGGTPMKAGLLTGAKCVAKNVDKFDLNRVLLVSDGHATDEYRNIGDAINDVTELSGVGITVSTYGLGMNFNEELMTSMAQSGKGNAFYAEDATILSSNFKTEFALAQDIVGKDVSIKVDVTKVIENVKGLPSKQDVFVISSNKLVENKVDLSSILLDASSWTAIKSNVEGIAKGLNGYVEISVEAKWFDIDEGKNKSLKSSIKIPFADKMVTNASKKDSEDLERIKEAEAAFIQLEAMKAAKMGNWDVAHNLVRSMSGMAGNNAYISGVAESLNNLVDRRDEVAFSKEAVYASVAMSTRAVDAKSVSTKVGDRFGQTKLNQGRE